MIYELRTYDLKVGRLADYLAIFEARGLPVLSRYATPVGFWYSGPTGTGVVDQVNHVWGYDSVAARIERRTALYADPAWVRDLVPAVSETFVGLRGQLVALDEGSEEALSGALARDHGSGPVVASVGRVGAAPAGPGAWGRWRMLTGALGRTLTLDPLDGFDFDPTDGAQGTTREIWHPARFSRLR